MSAKCCHQTASVPEDTSSREVADIFRLYSEEYRSIYSPSFEQLKVMHLIEICRTKALGGHNEKCDHCGYEQISYNSCRNRHCPKCQTMAKERWLNDRKAELLPIGYFHSVFTLPHNLNPIILCNEKILLDSLFQAVNETLQAFAKDPQWRLMGQLGFIAVLHTWSQTLMDHFHLHCLIPGGVLSFDKKQWIPTRTNFLFKIVSLAKEFRKRYLSKLQVAYDRNDLIFPGNTAETGTPEGFARLAKELENKKWMAYAKRPFAGPAQVLEYLGRYTHRVAISNHRIVSIDDGKVQFSYKDRTDDDKTKYMTVTAVEFIRRFLLHVLPDRFMKIRYFGFLYHREKRRNIELIRNLIDPTAGYAQKIEETVQEIMLRVTGEDITLCPRCKKGHMIRSGEIPGTPIIYLGDRRPMDSS